ncbi:DsbA family protein [Kluyvera sichuanensis]|uniref:DsbA family protein n=1 Tax=Kluyvera sichuanensis TaxID=2725494 RepID=UPI002FCFAD74
MLKRSPLAILLIGSLISLQAMATQTTVTTPTSATDAVPFTSAQEARIGEIAKEYLLAHPEVLVQVSQKLQAQAQEKQVTALTTGVLATQDMLLNDKGTPTIGPKDAKVVLIEFFDYQCSVCAQQAPVVEALMKANPQVRYVFKEWPIFGSRWESSMHAAETGIQIWQQKGADAYLAYHNAVYATGHDEGQLTLADIKKSATPAGPLKDQKANADSTLTQIDALAQTLGLRGTPGLIVMPVSGATAKNVTVIPGGTSLENLQSAIEKAAGQ